jgi:hypothetical protein
MGIVPMETMNEHRWSLRVTATAGETATALVRRHQFVVGRPLHFDAEYPNVVPIEYALGALGAEAVNGLRGSARRARTRIDGVEALIEADLQNPLSYFDVVGIPGNPALARVRLKLYVATPDEPAAVEQLWNKTKAKLPLAGVFDAAGLLDTTLTFV